jgi:hypothetical protein
MAYPTCLSNFPEAEEYGDIVCTIVSLLPICDVSDSRSSGVRGVLRIYTFSLTNSVCGNHDFLCWMKRISLMERIFSAGLSYFGTGGYHGGLLGRAYGRCAYMRVSIIASDDISSHCIGSSRDFFRAILRSLVFRKVAITGYISPRSPLSCNISCLWIVDL